MSYRSRSHTSPLRPRHAFAEVTAVLAALALLVVIAPGKRASADGPPVPPRSGAMWGALVAIGDKYGATRQLAQTAFEDQVGRQDMFERVYYQWDEGWPSVWDYWSRDQGHQLMISWGARRRDGTFARWRDIARGVN